MASGRENLRDVSTIGELARATDTKVETIRYYESIGLMPAPMRSSGNQRRYDRQHRSRLAFIRHSRELGFRLEDIRSLLALCDNPGHSCDDADAIARQNLQAVASRLARLEALKVELARMVSECGHGRIAECRVIEVLADHAHCVYGDHEQPQ
jgi:DNA-binding transcriptional MerR regulator